MLMKDIPGHEGRYAATDDGRIYSHLTKQFLSQFDNGWGYMYVQLTENGKTKPYRVNRLVALAWLPQPLGKNVVGHKDDNRKNNDITNLYWTTQKENVQNGQWKELQDAKGKKHVKVQCVETGEVFKNMGQAAKSVGVCRANIANAVYGRQHTAGGYHWVRVVENDENIQ